MIDYLNDFEDKGFFTCADILNESEREELLSNIDQIERNVLGHPENKKEMDPNNTSRLRKINDLTLNHQYFFEISKKTEILKPPPGWAICNAVPCSSRRVSSLPPLAANPGSSANSAAP